MKHVGSFFSKLAAYGVAFLVTSLVASVQAQPQQGTAKVMAVRGTAQYSEAGGAWMLLKVGKVLRSGAVLKTAAGSQVDLFLKVNGPVVRVTADTTLGLDKLLFEETGAETVIDTELNLSNGRILGNVKKMAAASKYDVKVPTGTVGIRGTEYDISTSGIVHVITGQVIVTYISPTAGVRQYTVNAGQTFTPPPATTPDAPGTVASTLPPVGIELERVMNEIRVVIPGPVIVVTPAPAQPQNVEVITPPGGYNPTSTPPVLAAVLQELALLPPAIPNLVLLTAPGTNSLPGFTPTPTLTVLTNVFTLPNGNLATNTLLISNAIVIGGTVTLTNGVSVAIPPTVPTGTVAPVPIVFTNSVGVLVTNYIDVPYTNAVVVSPVIVPTAGEISPPSP